MSRDDSLGFFESYIGSDPRESAGIPWNLNWEEFDVKIVEKDKILNFGKLVDLR